MNKEELYSISFQLILHSGNARSLAMEAMQDARNKDYEQADQKIKESENELLLAHKFQTQLIQREAGGDKYDIPILLVHAQDHLMTAMTVKDMAIEIIELRKEKSHN
ncbi:PTS lactose/cellobiose transporter subunit IIA [Neobacillus cucumis]|uniref:PTS lactose/cellobiose transporter subunit IIA n=1 Tax=Neobacillus cucumis TaxID=1740721 RepID=UPI00285368FF|nr:PTS lactose/cellobiose transporter subunit IIA [Neobacillus cucumis]MDR4948069.1 PTS lactose/cellobiose transporter subunit IIA [Neobacillus cucumis]